MHQRNFRAASRTSAARLAPPSDPRCAGARRQAGLARLSHRLIFSPASKNTQLEFFNSAVCFDPPVEYRSLPSKAPQPFRQIRISKIVIPPDRVGFAGILSGASGAVRTLRFCSSFFVAFRVQMWYNRNRLPVTAGDTDGTYSVPAWRLAASPAQHSEQLQYNSHERRFLWSGFFL